MNDDFTMALRLCDDDGMVSNERADPQPGPFLNLTYLDIHRNLQAHTRPNTCALVVDPFFCTGSAHLAGEHIRCTSPAHDRDLLGVTLMGDNQAALHVEWPSGVAGAQCDECLRFTVVRPSGRDLFGDPTGWTCRPCALGLDDDFGSEGGGLDG